MVKTIKDMVRYGKISGISLGICKGQVLQKVHEVYRNTPSLFFCTLLSRMEGSTPTLHLRSDDHHKTTDSLTRIGMFFFQMISQFSCQRLFVIVTAISLCMPCISLHALKWRKPQSRSTGINRIGRNLMSCDSVNCQEFVCIPRIVVICEVTRGPRAVDERQRKVFVGYRFQCVYSRFIFWSNTHLIMMQQ